MLSDFLRPLSRALWAAASFACFETPGCARVFVTKPYIDRPNTAGTAAERERVSSVHRVGRLELAACLLGNQLQWLTCYFRGASQRTIDDERLDVGPMSE